MYSKDTAAWLDKDPNCKALLHLNHIGSVISIYKSIRSHEYPLATTGTCKLQDESSSFWDLKHLCSHKLQKIQDCRKIPELHGSHTPVPTSTFPTHLRLAGGRQAVGYPDHPSSSADTPPLLKSSQVQGVFNWFINFEFWNDFDKKLHFWTTLSGKPQADDIVRCLGLKQKVLSSIVWNLARSRCWRMINGSSSREIRNSSSWAFSEFATLWRSCVASLTFVENLTAWAGCSTYVVTNQPANQQTNSAEFLWVQRPALVILKGNKSTPNCGWHDPVTYSSGFSMHMPMHQSNFKMPSKTTCLRVRRRRRKARCPYFEWEPCLNERLKEEGSDKTHKNWCKSHTLDFNSDTPNVTELAAKTSAIVLTLLK